MRVHMCVCICACGVCYAYVCAWVCVRMCMRLCACSHACFACVFLCASLCPCAHRHAWGFLSVSSSSGSWAPFCAASPIHRPHAATSPRAASQSLQLGLLILSPTAWKAQQLAGGGARQVSSAGSRLSAERKRVDGLCPQPLGTLLVTLFHQKRSPFPGRRLWAVATDPPSDPGPRSQRIRTRAPARSQGWGL